jgi:hypothetical protein
MAIGLATFDRLRAAGKVGPAAIRLSGTCLRFLRAEALEWLRCRDANGTLPDAAEWAARRVAQRDGRPV